MAPPVRGAGGTLGIGIETVWGTAVARSNWKEMRSMGLMRDVESDSEQELGRLGAAAGVRRFPFQVHDFAGGPLEFNAAYDDSTILLLTQILGAVATSGVGPYDHLITLASPPPIGMTLEQISGTAPTGSGLSGKMSEVFEGCKCNGGKISITAGGLMTVETEIIAQTSGGLVAAGTPTYTTGGERIKHHQTSGVTVGGVARALTGLTINVTRDLQRNHELGSLFTSEPYEGGGGLEVTLELRTKWQSDAFDAALIAGTQADVVIPFLGSGSKALTITAHNALVTKVGRPVSDRGSIEQSINMTAYSDGTDWGLAMLFTNANALATAN